MNQRVEITLEGALNNFTYKLQIPVGASFDDALLMMDQFKGEVQRMKEVAASQQKQTEDSQSS